MPRSRRLLVLLGLVLLAPGGIARADKAAGLKPEERAAPQRITGLRVEIIERGVYQTSAGVVRQMPNGIGETLVDAVELGRSTTAIPARPGVSFGLEFLVHGRPAGAEIELTTTVVFPAPGLMPPGGLGPVASSTAPILVLVGAPGPVYRGYTFDFDWEVVPGPWRFEVRAGDQLLAVQSFIVTSESGFRR